MVRSTGSATPRSWTDVLRARAADTPEREAFTFLLDGESQRVRWDYRTLDARARTIAAALKHSGVKPGDRALLLYAPGPEFIAAFHGCLYAGVIAVPAYPPRSAEHERALPRLAGILGDAEPAVILTAGAKMLGVVSQCAAAAAGGTHLPCLDTETLADSSADDWKEPAGVTRDFIAFLQYTSGSTSAPKGVKVTHGNLLHNSAAIRDAFGHRPESRGVIWLPPYHDMGLIGGILQPIFAGFPVTLMPPAAMLQRPLRWLQAVSDWRATTSGGPDFAFDLAVRSIKPEDRAALDLGCWEIAYSGAEPVRRATLDRFAETFAPCGFRRENFYPCYGLAEATLFATGGRRGDGATSIRVDTTALRENQVRPPAAADDTGAAELVACGQSIPGGEVRVVDPQTRVPAAPNRVGEIWLRSPSVAAGYWQQPDATAKVFGARLGGDAGAGAAWLRTGDLGFVGPGGHVYVTGRAKDLIIVRGRNHYPQDVEQTAGASHPALRAAGAAAFGVDVDGGERLVVVFEVERTRRDADPAEVFGAAREAVTRGHDLPVHAMVLLKPGRLPRTSSGKVRRHACREAFLSGEDLGEIARWVAPSVSEAPAPAGAGEALEAEPDNMGLVTPGLTGGIDATEVENWLLAKLAATLALPIGELDASEPFARYGLDSANAVALAGEIAVELNLDLEATLFWDYPSVRALAGHLAEVLASSDATSNRAA